MLDSGEADIGIATESLDDVPSLASFPFYEWRHAVIVPEGHPLASAPSLSLEELARHPLITYHDGYTGRARIDRTFAAAGLAPDIVLTALDSDVIKTYVELGLGVGIIAEMAISFCAASARSFRQIPRGSPCAAATSSAATATASSSSAARSWSRRRCGRRWRRRRKRRNGKRDGARCVRSVWTRSLICGSL